MKNVASMVWAQPQHSSRAVKGAAIFWDIYREGFSGPISSVCAESEHEALRRYSDCEREKANARREFGR